MKTNFSDEQILQMIKEQEAGEKTADVCRRHQLRRADDMDLRDAIKRVSKERRRFG